MKQLTTVSLLVVFAVFSFAVWAVEPTTPGSDVAPTANMTPGTDMPLGTHNMTPGSDEPTRRMAKSTAMFTPEILKAKDLIGMKVENPQAEKLGSVEDIVLTGDRNRVAFAVISTGGAMGIGEKYHAVPWPAFSRSTADAKVLLINKDKAALEKSPSFEKNNWPDMAQAQWTKMVHEFYDQKHEPETMASAAATQTEERRASKLLGMNVKSRQGQTLGEIKDIALDTHKGDVVYGILSLATPVATTGAEMAVVPWTSLAIEPKTRTAELSVDKSVLDSVAFRKTAIPNLADREFARRTYEQFNRQPYWDVLGYTAPGGLRERMTKMEHAGWAADSAYNRMFDPSKVSTMKGTIESVGSFVPEKGARPGVEITMRTEEGKVTTVQLGPHSFMRTQDMLPAIGDQVQIKGCMAQVNGQSVCLACEIEKGGKTVQIRDSQGTPQWETLGSLRVKRSMDPNY